jgi:hypothetical protein
MNSPFCVPYLSLCPSNGLHIYPDGVTRLPPPFHLLSHWSFMLEPHCRVFQRGHGFCPPPSWAQLPQASLSQFYRGRCEFAMTLPLLVRLQGQRKCDCLGGAGLVCQFFHKTLLLIICISVHLMWGPVSDFPCLWTWWSCSSSSRRKFPSDEVRK